MLLLEYTPHFLLEDATALANKLYGLKATAQSLPSERDQNFLLETEAHERFVLKIANALEERSLLEAQNAALVHIGRRFSFCPRVIPTSAGDEITQTIAPSGTRNLVRLVTYLPGMPLAKIETHSGQILKDLGRGLGQLDEALATFDHPAIHRDFHWDLANGLRVIGAYGPLIDDRELKALVDNYAGEFERELVPILPTLRRSPIHNDANDHNVLVEGSDDSSLRVVGLIDFGDMVHSYTVGDLAVAIAYAILDKPDPLAAAAEVAAAYHAELPLNDAELKALFDLVCMRLCMSVCHAAQQQRRRPEDDYLSISQQAIREVLPRLAVIDRDDAAAVLRQACGLPHTLLKK